MHDYYRVSYSFMCLLNSGTVRIVATGLGLESMRCNYVANIQTDHSWSVNLLLR